jgi:hypothetical protein
MLMRWLIVSGANWIKQLNPYLRSRVLIRVKSVFTGKDAGEEIARINDEIAAEDNAINARRDAAVNEREAERQRRRAAIEGEPAGVEDELNRALAVRGLGAESLSERTAKAAEQTAANTKKLVQEAQHGGLVFA